MPRPPMQRICVFCGSRPGNRPEYLEAARQLGSLLAERRIGLVYGGASVGVMGAVADAVLTGGGEVIGVIPDALVQRELAHDHLTELRVVSSMHERKALMEERSDVFIALPGGFGTLEELLEIVTWAQLGLHGKAIVLLNTEDYYDALLGVIERGVAEGFIPPSHASLLAVAPDPAGVLELLLHHAPPVLGPKWLTQQRI
jgi:uncharacterized protein (TIGR00730 family)